MRHLQPNEFAKIIAKYCQDNPQAPYIQSPQDLKATISDCIREQDFSRAIYKLMELEDCEHGIKWHVIEKEYSPSSDGHPIIIRDARAVANSDDNGYGLVINALNQVRATLALCKSEDKQLSDNEKYSLTVLLNNFWDHFKDSPREQRTEDTALFIFSLTQFVSKKLNIKPEAALKRLGIAKDYMNFEDDSFHVTTISQHTNPKDNSVTTAFKCDIALCGLTEEQKVRFNIDVERNANNEWFWKLEPWERKLVRNYIDKITNEPHAFPTQLRHIPGARNFYRQCSGHIDNHQAVITNTTHHSGTIAHLGGDLTHDKAENHLLSQANLRQIAERIGEENTPKDKAVLSANIHMLTLNSTQKIGPGRAKERSIVEQSADATLNQPGDHTHTNLPINLFRLLPASKRTAGMEDILNTTANLIHPLNVKSISNLTQRYLQGQPINKFHFGVPPKQYSKETDIYNLLESKVNNISIQPEYTKILRAAIRVRHLSNINQNLRDPSNRNLELAALSSIINSELKSLGKTNKDIVSACQSGKDRDGLVLFTIQLYQLFYQQTGSFPNESSLANQDNIRLFEQLTNDLAKAWHQQFMAGFQGSTLGAFGIKSDTKLAIPDYWPQTAKDTLVLKTASYNKNLPCDVSSNYERHLPSLLSNHYNDSEQYLNGVLSIFSEPCVDNEFSYNKLITSFNISSSLHDLSSSAPSSNLESDNTSFSDNERSESNDEFVNEVSIEEQPLQLSTNYSFRSRMK